MPSWIEIKKIAFYQLVPFGCLKVLSFRATTISSACHSLLHPISPFLTAMKSSYLSQRFVYLVD